MERNNEDKKNYMTMLRKVMKQLYQYLQEIVPEHKKSELVPFYSFNDSILILGVINLNRNIIDSECDKYINRYEIPHEHKPKLLEFIDMIVSVGEHLRHAMCI